MVTAWGTNARRKKTLKSVFINIPKGERSVGKPRNGWLDDIENGLKEICVRGWRKLVKDGDTWELILKEAKVLHGPYSQWRRNKEYNPHHVIIFL